MVACTSPSLIAACHVLHRLHAPRHPPCALSSLTIKLAQNKPSCLDQELLQPTCVLSLPSLLSSEAISRNLYLFSFQRSKNYFRLSCRNFNSRKPPRKLKFSSTRNHSNSLKNQTRRLATNFQVYTLQRPCQQGHLENLGKTLPMSAEGELVSGGEGARTPDLRLAKPALCQLSYTPTSLLEAGGPE